MEFSLNRVALLFRMQWMQHKKFYSWSLAGIPLIMTIVFFLGGFMSGEGLRPDLQGGLFVAGLLLGGILFGTHLFGVYNRTSTKLAALSIPASNMERTFHLLVWQFVVFPAYYLLTAYVALRIAYYLDTNVVGNIQPLVHLDHSTVLITALAALPIFLFNAVTSIVFRKQSFVKTLALALLLLFITVGINRQITSLIAGRDQPVLKKEVRQAIRKAGGNDYTVRYTPESSPFMGWGLAADDRRTAGSNIMLSVDAPVSARLTSQAVYAVTTLLLLAGLFYKIKEKTL